MPPCCFLFFRALPGARPFAILPARPLSPLRRSLGTVDFFCAQSSRRDRFLFALSPVNVIFLLSSSPAQMVFSFTPLSARQVFPFCSSTARPSFLISLSRNSLGATLSPLRRSLGAALFPFCSSTVWPSFVVQLFRLGYSHFREALSARPLSPLRSSPARMVFSFTPISARQFSLFAARRPISSSARNSRLGALFHSRYSLNFWRTFSVPWADGF